MHMRLFFILALLAVASTATPAERDARQIVRDAVDHWRGLSS